MKFSLATVLAFAFAAPALCQQIQIIEPAPNTSLSPGQTFDVTVLQPDFSQGFTDVGVAIALASCNSASPCPDKSNELGFVLFHGGLNPTTPIAPHMTAVYQNISVTVPSDFPFTGPAALSAVQFLLAGAGPFPTYDVVNITVNIV